MNKKGMTLVELIAVIAILGILTVMVSPAIMGIRTMVLNNTLDSKIAMIKAGALEYGMQHINEIPSVVDTASNNSTVPCICDCTQTLTDGDIYGIFDIGGDSCKTLCGKYDEENDKSSDGAYKRTIKTGDVDKCANGTYCKLVTVNQLIQQGYVVGDKDNKELLENPFSDKPLNESQVCIRYTNNDAYNRRLIAYIVDERSLKQ